MDTLLPKTSADEKGQTLTDTEIVLNLFLELSYLH